MSRANPPAPASPVAVEVSWRDSVHVWIRRDAQAPPRYSVRFSVDQGEGVLKWPGMVGRVDAAAALSGAVAGLDGDDLHALFLLVREGVGAPWVELPVWPADQPEPLEAPTGTWHPVPVEPELTTDVTDVGAVRPRESADDVSLLPDAETDTETTLAVAAVEVGPAEPAPAPKAGSALVKSLVQRIRQQDQELAALRARVAELEAQLS